MKKHQFMLCVIVANLHILIVTVVHVLNQDILIKTGRLVVSPIISGWQSTGNYIYCGRPYEEGILGEYKYALDMLIDANGDTRDYINKDDVKITDFDNIDIIEKYDKQDYYELSEENSNKLLNVNNTKITFNAFANVPFIIEKEEIINQMQYDNCMLYANVERNSIFTIKIKI